MLMRGLMVDWSCDDVVISQPNNDGSEDVIYVHFDLIPVLIKWLQAAAERASAYHGGDDA